MENTMTYPHVKIFIDTDNEVHLLTYTTAERVGHKHDMHIGMGLIDFITLDVSEYEQALQKANAGLTLAYDDMRNHVFDLADFFKGKHDAVYFFLIGKLNAVFAEETYADKQFERCFDELFSVLILHRTFSFGVHLCLDIDNQTQYTMPEKFVGFVTQHERYNNFILKTGVKITPTYKGKLDYEMVKSINKKTITDTKVQLRAIHREQEGVSLASYTLLETLEELLYFEFIELLKQGLQVKKCKLCGRYFVLTNKHNADFCDRVYRGHRTCKQVGAKKNHTETVAADPVLQEYQRVYKRYYARGDMPFDGDPDNRFYGMTRREWAKMATDMRKRYLKGEIGGEELIEGMRG